MRLVAFGKTDSVFVSDGTLDVRQNPVQADARTGHRRSLRRPYPTRIATDGLVLVRAVDTADFGELCLAVGQTRFGALPPAGYAAVGSAKAKEELLADAQDGPIVFLVDKGLPSVLRGGHDPNNRYFSIINVGESPVAVRAFNVYARPSQVMQVSEERRELPEGSLLVLMGPGEMRTLQVGGFQTYSVNNSDIARILGPQAHSNDDQVAFAMECFIVGDDVEHRVGWPRLRVSRSALDLSASNRDS